MSVKLCNEIDVINLNEEKARPLMSEYLRNGYKNEDLDLKEVEYTISKNQLTTIWDIGNPFPSKSQFHLSGHTANLIVQQTAIMYILLDLGFTKKEHEIWVNKLNFLFFKPITDPENIRCTIKCMNRTVEIVKSNSHDGLANRFIFDFKIDINRFFKINGFGIIEVPYAVREDDKVTHPSVEKIHKYTIPYKNNINSNPN